MTYKPNAILDGMTREEAKNKLVKWINDDGCWAFVHAGALYPHPKHILGEGTDTAWSRATWCDWFDAYYDAKEAASKPRWVEPKIADELTAVSWTGVQYASENIYGDMQSDIARTNARRKIEAFIKANGGSGAWELWNDGAKWISMEKAVDKAGAITCATRGLAKAVIERYPDELRLLMG